MHTPQPRHERIQLIQALQGAQYEAGKFREVLLLTLDDLREMRDHVEEGVLVFPHGAVHRIEKILDTDAGTLFQMELERLRDEKADYARENESLRLQVENLLYRGGVPAHVRRLQDVYLQSERVAAAYSIYRARGGKLEPRLDRHIGRLAAGVALTIRSERADPEADRPESSECSEGSRPSGGAQRAW